MLIFKKMLVFVALSCFCSACIHLPMSRHYAGPETLPQELAAYYAYNPSSNAILENKILKEEKRYLVRRIEIPAVKNPESESNGFEKQQTIVMDYYEIKGDKKTPVIIVLPILGGNNQESEIFCSYFAKHGIASLIVHRDDKQKDSTNIDNMELSLRTMVIDHKLVIDWIATQPKLDSANIGAFGISMGGIKAALLAGLDPRIKATVLSLAGSDIPYILMHSKEKGVMRRIRNALSARNISRDDLYHILQQRIKTDPKTFARYIDARNVLVVNALFDRVVPHEKERELWEAIGRPEKINVLAGHYTALLYIFYVRQESLYFFERKFGLRLRERK